MFPALTSLGLSGGTGVSGTGETTQRGDGWTVATGGGNAAGACPYLPWVLAGAGVLLFVIFAKGRK